MYMYVFDRDPFLQADASSLETMNILTPVFIEHKGFLPSAKCNTSFTESVDCCGCLTIAE